MFCILSESASVILIYVYVIFHNYFFYIFESVAVCRFAGTYDPADQKAGKGQNNIYAIDFDRNDTASSITDEIAAEIKQFFFCSFTILI